MHRCALLLLIAVAACSAFHLSVTTTGNGASTSTEVVVALSDCEHHHPHSKIVDSMRSHMHKLARHMDSMFGGDPFDLSSFFSNPIRHFKAMEQSLLGHLPSSPPNLTHKQAAPSLLKHLAKNQNDPKVSVAAACHSILPMCLTREASWTQMYSCILAHKHFGSDKCVAVLDKTAHLLGETKSDASEMSDDLSSEASAQTQPVQKLLHRLSKLQAAVESVPNDDDLKGEATPGYLTGDVEAPEGTKDMGGWVSRVYTREQRARLNVDEFGAALHPAEGPPKRDRKGPAPVQSSSDEEDAAEDVQEAKEDKKEARREAAEEAKQHAEDKAEDKAQDKAQDKEDENKEQHKALESMDAKELQAAVESVPNDDDLKGEATPGYLTGDVEAPEGTKDMGGWVSRVYTPEQRARLNVDEFGAASNHKHHKPARDSYVKHMKKHMKKAWKHCKTMHLMWMMALLLLVTGCLGYCCVSKCCQQPEELDTTYEFLLESETQGASSLAHDQL